jgi:hypothetical protein
VLYDPTNGTVVSKGWRYAASTNSTWARGEAWANYGFTMAYQQTGDMDFLNTAQILAGFYITNAPPDYVPYWDYDDPNIPDAPKDSSAAAITLSALIDLSQLSTNAQQAAGDWNEAIQILNSLASTNYLAQGTSNSGVLLHGAGNFPPSVQSDVCLVYSDYYFIEALQRFALTYGRSSITYIPDTNFSGVDSFQYQACDSSGATATATVTVTVGLIPRISSSPATDQVTISFPTLAGKKYFVQYVNDFSSVNDWSNLATNIAGSGSVVSIMDATSQMNRFYRIGQN